MTARGLPASCFEVPSKSGDERVDGPVMPDDVARDETEERVVDLAVLGDHESRTSARLGVELRRPRATKVGLADDAAHKPARRHGLDRLGLHVAYATRPHERRIVDYVPDPL